MRALFGLETRFVTIIYLQRVAILALVTISIVVGLDISANIETVMNPAIKVAGPQGFARVIYYALLRASFVTPSVLLFAGVWGVVWAEYSLAKSRERIMLFNCGKSYIPSLAPALLVGAMVGLLHFALSGYVKPATVEWEAAARFRSYGLKFDRPAQSNIEWIAAGNFIIKARVEISRQVGLNKVSAFEFGPRQSLQRIVRAEHARPGGEPGHWTFLNGEVTRFGKAPGEADSRLRTLDVTPFGTLEVKLPLSPLWLENFGILPILLPQSVLNALVGQAGLVPDVYKYQMVAYERYASILYCLATVLLGAHLAMASFKSGMLPYRAFSVSLVGYAAYFLFSVTLMLGQYGYVPVPLAAWSIPLLTTILSAVVVFAYVRSGFRRPVT